MQMEMYAILMLRNFKHFSTKSCLRIDRRDAIEKQSFIEEGFIL